VVLKRELEALANEVRESGLDERRRTWMSQLLIVRTCAYLEQTALTISRAYINAKSGGIVKTFAASWLAKGNVPSSEALKQFIGRFDQGWANELDVLLHADNDRLHLDLAFLIDRRHQVAHSQSVSVPPSRALELNASASSIADWMVGKFNPW
jgi:hypothetical protein